MTGSSRIDPGRLLAEHRYAEALDECGAQITSGDESWSLFANRATSLVCLGRLDEALADFRTAAAKVRTPEPDPGAYCEEIATVQWLTGDYEAAIQTILFKATGLAQKTIHYADVTGGVGVGILLWFMGLRSGDTEAKQHAQTFLLKMVKKKSVQYWPGHLGLFIVDKMPFTEVLMKACGSMDMHQARAKAARDVLARRELCQALFYKAAKQLESGDNKSYFHLMRDCCSLRNPIVENEWYIARYESQRIDLGEAANGHRRKK